jgi:hypothetical protein
MRKRFRVEILVNDTPNMPTSESFASREEAEAYAKKVYEHLAFIQAYRIVEKKYPPSWSFEPIQVEVGAWESPVRTDKVHAKTPIP